MRKLIKSEIIKKKKTKNSEIKFNKNIKEEIKLNTFASQNEGKGNQIVFLLNETSNPYSLERVTAAG